METFVGDTIQLIVNTGMDISGFDTFILKFRRPDGSSGIWVAQIDPTNNNRILYTTLKDDLFMAGLWAVQAHVQLGNTMLHGRWTNFTVYNPLAEPHRYIMSTHSGKVLTGDPLTQLTH